MKKMRYIEQTTIAECGLCCLSMLFSIYNVNITPLELKANIDYSTSGLNLKILRNICKQLKFDVGCYKVKEIKQVKPPYMIQIKDNHFVCISKINVNKNKVEIYDPAIGIYTVKLDTFSKDKYYILKINDYYGEKITSKKIFPKYLEIIKKSKIKWLLALGLSIILQVLTISIPIVIKNIINTASKYYVSTFILFSFLLIVIYGILFLLRSKINVDLKIEFNNTLVIKFVKNLLNCKYKYFDNVDNSELVYRYNGTIVIRDLLSSEFINIWLNICVSLFSLIYIYVQSKFLGSILLLLLLIQIMISLCFIILKQQLVNIEIVNQSKNLATFMDILNLISNIKINNLEDKAYNYWKKSLDGYSLSMKKEGYFTTMFHSMIETINYLTPLVICLCSLYLLSLNKITIGSVFAIFLLSSNAIIPVSQAINSIDSIMYAHKFFKRIVELEYVPKENLKTGINILDYLVINLKNINFKYSITDKNVLKNINLSIEKDKFIGITGKSGSGKSTLGMLLMGMYDNYTGDIFINQTNIKDINKSEMRKIFTSIPQKNKFLNDSILNNIVMWRDFDPNLLKEVCKIACIWEDIQELPMKFETIISDDSNLLSGGQLQRIAIARALYGKPKIIIFDEATSALDSVTEKNFLDNLTKLKCTKIMITHRLNTIINADSIILMDNGEIIANGKHNELLNNKNYKKIYQEYCLNIIS